MCEPSPRALRDYHLCSTVGETEARKSMMQSCPAPHSPWAETLWHSRVVPRAAPSAGATSLNSNPSARKPFPIPSGEQHNRVPRRAGEGDEMFRASSCSRCCFLALCFVCSSKRKEYTCRVCFGLCLWMNATTNCKWSN